MSETNSAICSSPSSTWRGLAIDPEQALRRSCRKFDRRFRRVETLLAAAGKTPGTASLDEMEAEWQKAKAEERR